MTTQDPSAQPPTPAPTDPPEPTPAPADPPEQAPDPAEPKKPDPMAQMRRERDKAQREADEAKAALAERERKEAEEKGQWEEVAKQNETRAETAEQTLARERAERRVESIASKPQFELPPANEGDTPTTARFVNPDEALALLPDETDLTDEDVVTEALQALAASRPHLLHNEAAPTPTPPTPTPSGAPKPGGGPQPGSQPKLTREYIKGLSVSEIQKLRRERPDDFKAAMSGS